jgi:outer membrane protein OmpA-like peptidoglycan-associated protein
MRQTTACRALQATALFLASLLYGCSKPATSTMAPPAPAAVPAPPPQPPTPQPEPAALPAPQPAPPPSLPDKVILDGTMLKSVNGQWQLTPQGQETIRQVAGQVQSLGPEVVLLVTGYSSATGHAAHNLVVSKHRAEFIARRLEAAGVPASRIKVRGLGQADPVASNATAAGRLRNQRVEVVYQRNPGTAE